MQPNEIDEVTLCNILVFALLAIIDPSYNQEQNRRLNFLLET